MKRATTFLALAAVACALPTSATAASMSMPAMSMPSHANMPQLHAPDRNDPRFVRGSTGPVVSRGMAPTLRIPDGLGFGGERGRRQNRGDRKRDNYSATDANFNNELGLLARNPDTGAALTYVEHIQTYAAAGYLEADAPSVYAQLVQHQNAGVGTVLGGAAHLMGLVQKADPAEAGVDASMIPLTVPGTPLDARASVRSPKDMTGQNWARPHHAASHFAALKSLVAIKGLTWQRAVVLSGDDAVSGAGRLNGQNTQNGPTGFNRDELTVWETAARVQRASGAPILTSILASHHMDTLAPDALSRPHVNRLVSVAPTDRSTSRVRMARLQAALLNEKLERAQPARTIRPDKFNVRNRAVLRASHLA